MSKIDRNLFLRCDMNIEESILKLNRLLANSFVLYIKLHRYSWYVKGTEQSSIASICQSEMNVWKEHIDQIVQLIQLLGGQPYATMIKYVKEATLEEATADDEVSEMLEQLMDDTTYLLKEMDDIIQERHHDQKERIIRHTLVPIEHHLFQLQQTCKNYLK